MAALADFPVGSTKNFSVTVTVNALPIDITADAVRILLKSDPDDLDANAVVDEVADVATSGATGIALFKLAPTVTDAVAPAKYAVEIKWSRAAPVEEHVLYSDEIALTRRIGDVP